MTIFLCGFMGCGKSAMGRALARRLDMPLIDTDAAIVEQEGMTIPEIFQKKGETYFRQVEADVVRSLCEKDAVVSCGGGAMLNPETAKAARSGGIVVLIDQSFRVCYSRIRYDRNRPIVQKHTRAQLERIYNQRDAVYRAHANVVIPAAQTPDATALRLIRKLGLQEGVQADRRNA
jgi:shikimate kinase